MQRIALLIPATMTVDYVVDWNGVGVYPAPLDRLCVFLTEGQNPAQGDYFDQVNGIFKPTVPTTIDGTVRRIEKIDFMRLFTMQETTRYNALRRQVAALTVADYSSSDPAVQALVSIEVAFNRFDLAAQIELTHPETLGAVNALAYLGIFDANEAAQRVLDVLAGIKPASL